jgi:hypothetical protein
MVVAAGAEMEDRGIPHARLVEPRHEIDVAGAILRPEIPVVVPDVEDGCGVRHVATLLQYFGCPHIGDVAPEG